MSEARRREALSLLDGAIAFGGLFGGIAMLIFCIAFMEAGQWLLMVGAFVGSLPLVHLFKWWYAGGRFFRADTTEG